MRMFFFVIYVMIGVCLFFPGCRVYLGGSDLEASAAAQVPGVDAPPAYEGRYDQNCNEHQQDVGDKKSEPD